MVKKSIDTKEMNLVKIIFRIERLDSGSVSGSQPQASRNVLMERRYPESAGPGIQILIRQLSKSTGFE